MAIFEFNRKFPSENHAIDFIVEKKYKGELSCPKCGCVHTRIYRQNYDRRKLYCNNCKSEFSALSGTIFERTHLDIRIWLYAIILTIISRKGMSALQLQRTVGIKSYKSAWRMLRYIRMAIAKEEYKEVFEVIVEIDETYIGGKPRKSNEHSSENENRKVAKRGKGTKKTPIIGVKERHTGRVHAVVSWFNDEGKTLTGQQLFDVLNKICKGGNTVVTDEYAGYNILDKPNDKGLMRLKIEHKSVYSLGNGRHTNGIESFWAVLKRGLYGIYHKVSVKYLQNYINEFCFRLNYRDTNVAFERLLELAVA